jgi:4-alpha-glucanotransferase
MSISGKLRREDPHRERINIPAIVPHFWRYRMHITLEALLKLEAFNASLKDKIKAAGR